MSDLEESYATYTCSSETGLAPGPVESGHGPCAAARFTGTTPALTELSTASISSLLSVRSGSAEDEDWRQEEAVLRLWGPGKLYEWMVSIDLELYADALQTRSIAGDAPVIRVLGMC